MPEDRPSPENPAKKYLQQYRKALVAERVAREELAETRALMGSTRSALSSIGSVRGTADEAFLSGDIERLEAEEATLMSTIKKCRRAKWRVKRAINRVEQSDLRKILKLRYIIGMGWERIAAILQYSDERYVHRLHGKALVVVQKKTRSGTPKTDLTP